MARCLTYMFAALLLVVGCKQQDVDDGKIAIKLSADSVIVSEEGGICEIGYSIKNPINGVTPTLRFDAKWIVDVDTSERGVLRFRVLVNDETTPREAVVELLYPSLDVVPQFVVCQSGVAEAKFDIAISDMQYSECTAQITPLRSDMPFIVMMAEKSYFSGVGIYDTTTLIDADVNYFNSQSTVIFWGQLILPSKQFKLAFYSTL